MFFRRRTKPQPASSSTRVRMSVAGWEFEVGEEVKATKDGRFDSMLGDTEFVVFDKTPGDALGGFIYGVALANRPDVRVPLPGVDGFNFCPVDGRPCDWVRVLSDAEFEAIRR